jgi:hypothetical protein
VRQDRADDQRVMRLEAALQRLSQRGELLAQQALGQVSEDLGVGRAGHQRVEHRPSRDAENVGSDAVKLDHGVLQRLMQPVGLALALSDLGFAIPRQRSEPPLGLGRDETGAQQSGLHQLTQPCRVRAVGLVTGNVLDMPGLHNVSSKSALLTFPWVA